MCDTPTHYALSFCEVSLNLLEYKFLVIAETQFVRDGLTD